MNYKKISTFTKRLILFFLVFCLILNNTDAYALPMGEVDFSRCKNITELTLRTELDNLVQEFFLDKTQFDFEKIVEQQWRVLNIGSVIDSEVDKATSIVRRQAGRWSKFKGSWIPDEAKALAEEVTSIAFSSPVFETELYKLSEKVANELSNRIDNISNQSSSYALNCVQKFIETQYSQAFTEAFKNEIKASVPDLATLNEPFDQNNLFLSQHKFGAGGIATIIVVQISKRIASEIAKEFIQRVSAQITERILGRLASVTIPFVGEIIGSGLLIYDVFKSFEGPLPEIQNSLKSLETKSALRSEVANVVEQELRNQSQQIAETISNDTYARWTAFQRDYEEVLNLTKEMPEFKKVLEEYGFSKVSSLIGIALSGLELERVKASIQNGEFERVLSLPPKSWNILSTSHDFSKVIDWANLAGSKIDAVVDYELYKHINPEELDRRTLDNLLTIRDYSTVSSLILLDIHSIRELVDNIPSQNLTQLTKKLSQKDLSQLANYINQYGANLVNKVVQFLLVNDPIAFKNSRVIPDFLSSGDVNDAIRFWQDSLFLTSIPSGIIGVIRGTISWGLFTDKYKYGNIAAFLLAGLAIILGVLTFCLGRISTLWLLQRLKSAVSSGQFSRSLQSIIPFGQSSSPEKSMERSDSKVEDGDSKDKEISSKAEEQVDPSKKNS